MSSRFNRAPLTDEVEVVVIGGGFGGLLAGARLREAGIKDIRIIETGGDFGGTWYWNRYPGAQCDIESYFYLPLLEELGYMPKEKYSFAPEIFEHSQRIAQHYDLYDNALLPDRVSRAALGRGRRALDRLDQPRRRDAGALRGDGDRAAEPAEAARHPRHRRLQGPHLPHQPLGLRLHRRRPLGRPDQARRQARRRSSAPAPRRSSACRILGAHAKQLYVFQRTPSSVDVRGNKPTDPDWARVAEARLAARRDGQLQQPGHRRAGRERTWSTTAGPTSSATSASRRRRLPRPRELSKRETAMLMELADFQKMNDVRARVDETVNDPATAEALKPWYRQFCKRPTFNDDYLPTFNRPNVKLVDTSDSQGVERITKTGVVANGVEYEVDCIIFATGFEVGTAWTRRAGYDMIGRDGADA